MAVRETEVAIVGGGPCGLFTALLLARAGVSCVVFERHAGLSNHPKAMGLVRQTLEMFRSLGLDLGLRSHALVASDHDLSVWSKALTHGEFGRVPFSGVETPETPVRRLHVPQTWTEQTLFEALEREPLAELCFHHTVDAVAETGETVHLQGRDGRGEKFECQAAWCVAADGAGSPVRASLGIPTEGPGEMGKYVNTFFSAEYGPLIPGRPALLYQTVCPEYAEFFVAVNGKDLWLMHHHLGEGETVEDFPPERLEHLIRQASGVPDVPVEIVSVDFWVMSPKVASEFRKGRVLLTGDASARLSPAGGLGMNTGLQAAYNLAWKLAAVVRGYAGGGLLDTYHEERHGTAVERMNSGNLNAQEVFEVTTLAIEGAFDQASQRISASVRAGTQLGQDLGVAYRSGAFVPDGSTPPAVTDPVNDYIPSATPGCRAPHVWLRRRGERISTLDLFGSGFVLLTGREGDRWLSDLPGGLPLFASKITHDGELADVEDDFEATYGIYPSGAVLVRPDGVVGARWAEAPEEPGSLARALDRILRKE